MKKLFTLFVFSSIVFNGVAQNNSFATADSLTLWMADTGTIKTSGEVNYYVVHMNHCGSLIFSLVNIPGLNLEMTAYSSLDADSIIGTSGYGGNRVMPLIVPSGDIYVTVDDHYSATSSSNYVLTAYVDTIDVYECDNNFATAYPLSDSTSLQATINGVDDLWSPSTDVDFYKIHMTHCGNLVVSLVNIPGLNLEMYAYSAPNTDSLIGYSGYGGNRDLELTPASGDVYVKVDDHYGATSFSPYSLTVFVDTGDAYECNNSFATAYPIPDQITLEAKIRGTNFLWSPPTDIDIYKVQMERCGTLNLNLTNIPGMNLEMYCYNSPNADSVVGYSGYGGNRSLYITGAQGDMYVQVDDHYSATSASTYTLSVSLDTTDFYECNNSFATASPISDSTTVVAKIQGTNEGAADLDYYKVQMSQCGTLLLYLTNIPGLNLEMYVYSAPNPDSLVGYSGYGGNRALQITQASGDVYVLVDDHYGATSNSTYTLQVNRDTVDAYECNNFFSNAAPIPNNITLTARMLGTNLLLNPATDVDFYKITVDRCGVLELNLTNIPGLNLEMNVYATPNLDSSLGYSGYGGNRSMQVLVSPGDVYIEVDDHYGASSFTPYTLGVVFDTTGCGCNHSFATACQLPNNITFNDEMIGSNALMSPAVDVNYYKVTVDRCGVLVLDLTNIPGLNLEMYAYEAPNVNAQIGYSGYGGNRSLELMVLPGDVYFTVDDHYGATSFTPYTLAVSYDTSDVCECDNNFFDACTVTPNETLQAKIRGTNALEAPSTDVDFYIMNIPWCGQLVANLTNIPGLNLEVTAYNADDTAASIGYSGYGGNRNLTLNLAPGNYYFKVDDHYSATSPDFYTLAFAFAPNPAVPVVTPPGPFAFCIGDSVVLTTSSVIPHFWSNGDTSKKIAVFTTGIYADTVRLNNGCTAYSNAVYVEADSLPAMPTIIPPGPLSFCEGQGARLFSSSAVDNFWSTGDTVSVIDVSATGNYIDTVKSNVNCFSVSAPVSVTVNPNPPVPTITPPGPVSFCEGDMATLVSSSSTGNYWSNGNDGDSIAVTSAGNYIDTVKTDENCFSVSLPVNVTVNPNPPVPTITPAGPISFCQGAGISLISSSSINNYWSTGNNGDSIVVNSTGIYMDTVKSNLNCFSVSAPVNVTVNPNPPVPVITATNNFACPNQNDTLQSSATIGNHWSTGDTGPVIYINQAGAYTDTVINAFGCEAVSNTTDISTGELPVAGFTETNIQSTFTFTNTSTNGVTYLWNFGDGDTSTGTNPVHTYANGGLEVVTLITTNSCGSDTFKLEVNVTTGITSVNNTELWKVTPNPCEICQLTGTADAKNLVITDVTGRVCKAILTKTTVGYQIELPGAAGGIYFIRDLRTEEVLKFVKQ